MAKLIAGEWERTATSAPPLPQERVDVCNAMNPRWQIGEPVKMFMGVSGNWYCDVSGAVMAVPTWFRRYHWLEPQDIDIAGAGHRESVDLELRQDGSAIIRMHKGSDGVVGEITIPAADLETVAQWFTKAVEANKQ